MLVVGNLDPQVADHLNKALTSHLRWCRENGIRVPAAIDDLFTLVVSGGQGRSNVGSARTAAHDAEVALLTLTYDQAANRLNVSLSTLRRLVKSGDLASVELCSAPRIRASDLALYVSRLEIR